MKDEQDDIVLDSETEIDDSVIAEEHQGDTIKKLKEKLKASEAKAKEHLDGWQRAQAEFLNLRKRDAQENLDRAKFASEAVVLDIIPVLDNFGIAMRNKEAWEALPKDWRIGMESIYSQLKQILETHGLVQYGKVGEKFDPVLHEAIETKKAESPEEVDHTVAEVLQPGYTLHERILRPAKVKVYGDL